MNDLDLYQNNDLAPYSPGTGLAPIQPADDWGETPDYLSDRQTVPVQPLPSQQVEANFQQLATVFTNDFASLGYVQKDIDKCIAWFRNNLLNPVQRMPAKKHSYQLWQYSNDPVMNAFANYAATQRFPQSLIQSICYWVQQLENVMAAQQAPVSSDPTDSLSDSQYEAVIAANERAIANTMGYLKDLWGDAFSANLRMVQTYFQSLPARDQAHLSQYSSGWIKGTSTPEVILGLYKQAIGSGTLPSGGAIATEIEQHEFVMKHDRKRWNSDERLQARYRELLRMRDG